MLWRFFVVTMIVGVIGCADRRFQHPGTSDAVEKDQRNLAAIPAAVDKNQKNRGWAVARGPIIAHIEGNPLFVLVESDPQYDNVVPMVVTRDEGSKYRLVAVDENGERIPLRPAGTFDTESATLSILRLGLPAEMKGNVRLTVEVLTPEAQAYLSHQAFEEASAKGMFILPPPEGAKPYPFSLKATDGNLVTSSQLKGTITLIECWRVECAPCISFIKGKLGSLAKKYSNELSIISVNTEDEPSVAQAKLHELLGEVPVGLKHVSLAPNEREFWYRSLGTNTVPYFLIMDKEGRLHAEYGLMDGEQVTKIIEELLGR